MAVEYLRSDFFVDSKAEVAVFRRKRGVACLPHFHDFYEVVFILGGRGIHVVDGVASRFQVGDILVIKPGEVHYYREVHEFSLASVVIAPDSAARVLPLFGIEAGNQLYLEEHTFRDACDLLRSIESHSNMLAKRFTFELVELLGRESFEVSTKTEPLHSIPELTEARLGPALQILEEGFERPIKVEELCKASFMSERSLYRHFVTVTGRSPIVYLNDLRLHQAMILLKRGELRVVDVAFVVGFNDQSYFNRQFSRLTGLPPGRWQKRPAHEW